MFISRHSLSFITYMVLQVKENKNGIDQALDQKTSERAKKRKKNEQRRRRRRIAKKGGSLTPIPATLHTEREKRGGEAPARGSRPRPWPVRATPESEPVRERQTTKKGAHTTATSVPPSPDVGDTTVNEVGRGRER